MAARFLDAARSRPADRRRRRHGRPRLERRAAAALPRGGEPARAGEPSSRCTSGFISAGAELIETNTFGANRRKLARALPRGRARSDQRGGGRSSRATRGRSPGRDVFIAGSIGPLGDARDDGDVRAASCSRSRRGSSRAAAPTSSWSRRSTTSTSSRRRSRPSAPCLEPPDRRAADLRRGRARRSRRDRPARRPSGCAHSTSPRSARTTAPGRSPRCAALEQMGGNGKPLAALPNVGLASLAGRPRHLPARDARVLRRVRRARARPRRADHRRLLRHARRPRSRRSAAAVDEERQAARAARRSRATRARHRARRGAARDAARTRARRGRVRRLGAARPAARGRIPTGCSRSPAR